MRKMTPEEFLKKHNLSFVTYNHPAVFTAKEAMEHCGYIDGFHFKNLLLTDQKKENYFLVVSPADQKIDLKSFALMVGVSKINFASAEKVFDLLGVQPGSVSPFGLLNDKERRIRLFLPRNISELGLLTFHPNDNTKTLQISFNVLERFLNILDYKINFY